MFLIMWFTLTLLLLLCGVVLIGVLIRDGGMSPIDEGQVQASGQRLATTDDGRKVAYLVYGSEDPDAPVVINMHGSGLEAGFERATYQSICVALGCRGVAISLPGCGFTDEKPGRQVKEWPAEDLQAVLVQEKIFNFHITGHSQGTPHAMAAAYFYGKRCLGLGLNAPLLPTALCEDLGMARTLGTGSTPSSAQLKGWSMAWYFSVLCAAFKILPPRFLSSMIKKGFPKVKADHELVNRFEDSMRRAVVRGTSGATWETAQDTCFVWGFEVRELEHKNAVVWHADDDSAVPSTQGKWLAEHLGASYRHEAEGYGHLTYCVGEYQEPKHSLIDALLKRAGQFEYS